MGISFTSSEDYNIAYLPYCSGDFWAGQQAQPDGLGLYYSGHLIVTGAIKKLVKEQNLGAARSLVLFGLSAGGLGSWVNIDYVKREFPNAKVSIYSIAGWFPETFVPPKLSPGYILLNDSLQILYSFTNPYLNQNCIAKNPRTPYICYSGQHVYPEVAVNTPVFIAQSIYDQWAAGFF